MAGEIDWTPVVHSLAATNWTAVFVAVVSGIAAVVGPFWLWKKQAKKESASVRASLVAEVAALIEIVDLRGFLAGLREGEATLMARQRTSIRSFQGNEGKEFFQVPIDSHYNRVYQGNVSRLGVLTEEDAKQIVRFYQITDGVRLDVIPGGVLAEGTTNPEAFKEAADLLETAIEIGRALTTQKPKPSRNWLFLKIKK